MGQYSKIRNGNMPVTPTPAPQSATATTKKNKPKSVEITKTVINGVPGIKIKLPF